MSSRKKAPIDPEIIKLMTQVTRLTGERNAAIAAGTALEKQLRKVIQQRNTLLNGGHPPLALPDPPLALRAWLDKNLGDAVLTKRLSFLENVTAAIWGKLQGEAGAFSVLVVIALLLYQLEQEMERRAYYKNDAEGMEMASLGAASYVKHYLDGLHASLGGGGL